MCVDVDGKKSCTLSALGDLTTGRNYKTVALMIYFYKDDRVVCRGGGGLVDAEKGEAIPIDMTVTPCDVVKPDKMVLRVLAN